ncbi:glycosyltransferase family protein [Acetobacter ascendens]|uniref:Uncharacterized protein n=1 Tax=Acetobacter ascendens TaxID=481146 RepID=A0A1Y0V0H5_9PROT|nr:hypothetical protein [Acetobacter ascendens]ARW11621.1 hypothetical protein S101447_02583 [Acetobacter ascendens]
MIKETATAYSKAGHSKAHHPQHYSKNIRFDWSVECRAHLPLLKQTERVRWLKPVSFFIAAKPSSSWPAETAGSIISGFSHPVPQFETSLRIINRHIYNLCQNDRKEVSITTIFRGACGKQTRRTGFECSRLIAAQQVIDALQTTSHTR